MKQTITQQYEKALKKGGLSDEEARIHAYAHAQALEEAIKDYDSSLQHIKELEKSLKIELRMHRVSVDILRMSLEDSERLKIYILLVIMIATVTIASILAFPLLK